MQKTFKKVRGLSVAKFREEALVSRHNNLVEARHKLTLQENRLIFWLVSQIHPEDKSLETYQVKVMELAQFIGIEKNKNIYEELRGTTKKLMARVYELYNPKTGRLLQVSPLSSAEYIPEEGIIELGFSEKMRPYLLELKEQGNFTKIEIKYLMRFSSTYAIRIYEIIKRETYRVNFFEKSIDDLKIILGLNKGQYAKFSVFRKWVLEVAQKEINAKTDIKVSYEYKKTARKITHIIFKITKNGADISYMSGSSDDKLLKQLEKLGFNAKDGAQLIEKYKDDPERITFAIDYVKNEIRQNNGIRNPAGLLKHVIKEDRRPQTSFRDELLKDDKIKRQQHIKIQAEIARFEQEINGLSSRIKTQSNQYQKYRTQEIVQAVENIEASAQEYHKTEFAKTLDSGIVKDMFRKQGWTHRLITCDAIEYLQDNNLLGHVLKQEDWEKTQGFKTRDEIKQDTQGLKNDIKTIQKKAFKTV